MRWTPLLLRVWRDVPFPNWTRRLFLRLINPSFTIGAMALVQDDQGRILVLEHTYRRHFPWGLPGGWLKRGESPEAGIARELWEETGFRVSVDRVLAVDFFDRQVLDMLFRCTILSGQYHPTDETRSCRWAEPSDLPELMANQLGLLQKAGVLPVPLPATPSYMPSVATGPTERER